MQPLHYPCIFDGKKGLGQLSHEQISDHRLKKKKYLYGAKD